MPIIAFAVICWRYLKKADSSFTFESIGSDLHAIDSLMTRSWEFSNPLLSNSGVNNGPKTAISGFVVSEGNEQGVDMLLPMSHHSRSSHNSSTRDSNIKYPSSADVLTVLLLTLHPGTWSGIIDERLKAEFQTLVSTDDLPDVLKREVCCHNPSIPICLLLHPRKMFSG